LTNAPLSLVYQKAFSENISSVELFTKVEKDEWLYDTFRYGKPTKAKAMVCVNFACQMLKAGKVFGDLEVNCNEFNMKDLYKLRIYDEN
jgi:hypothetical protein